MADLRIKATADTTAAKAALRELSQEDANRLVREKEANLRRRMDAAETAKAQVAAAKQAGQATREELEGLKRAQRIAVADQRAAIREVRAARSEAARADRAELRRQLAEQREMERKEAISARARAGTQRQQDEFEELRSSMRYRGRVVRSGGRGPRRGRADDQGEPDFLDGLDGYGSAALKRVAGPAAIIGGLMSLINAQREIVQELKDIRASMAEQTISTGESSLGLSSKLRKFGMNDRDIQSVLQKVQGRPGALSNDELAQLAENGLAAGYGTPKELLGYIESEAQKRERATMPEEELALRARAMARQNEIRNTLAGRDHASAKNREDIAVLERKLFMDEANGGSMLARMGASADVWLAEMGWHDSDKMKAAGGREQFWNMQYNRYAGRNGGTQTIMVRIDPDSIRQLGGGRPLGGE